jgi:hypothetical protein
MGSRRALLKPAKVERGLVKGCLEGAQKVGRGASGSESPPRVRFQRVEGVGQVENGCISMVHIYKYIYRLTNVQYKSFTCLA